MCRQWSLQPVGTKKKYIGFPRKVKNKNPQISNSKGIVWTKSYNFKAFIEQVTRRRKSQGSF